MLAKTGLLDDRMRLFVVTYKTSALFKVSITIAAENIQGPVVQSIISLTSSLVVKVLTVLVSTISNPQVFLLKKCE